MEPTGNQPGTQRNTWGILGETRGNHGGTIRESYGKSVKHFQPGHQHPQQAILGDGLRLFSRQSRNCRMRQTLSPVLASVCI